ncbi:filamentous hemagglutinin family protein [Methylicorpusculum oleiharenae]|uniref:filamentous haemagglutinin family protein n=1 Tax=Methylicorpusculum oleiharenae TaxID=1338687 RepID=UPI001357B131|nr:filamentous haemagglutinin family protein [Methylicorpusculum oleiharenae]MCD2451858.1 filamentous hemagglutinin family protein [Methylicorpusculum oleiharenae]
MANSKRIKQSGFTAATFRLKPTAACVRVIIAGAMVAGSVAQVQAELPVPSAVWASMGGASRQVLGNQMRIDQHTDRAILNWQSFNIGKENSVHFQQPGSTSIALNRIFQNDPSRILGALTANGQVYLVNRNGFVFGKDSRVDVRGLVASTLDVSDEVFTQGITKVFANDGSAAFQGNGDFYQKNQDGSFKLDAAGNKIKAAVTIEKGAQIKASDGQNILIIAPTISNGGYIESNDRQVILAAATDKVYLQESGNDGLLVEVQTGGEVNNLGEIASKRGKVTLVGFAVNQNGKVSASTSMNINGNIRLLARENATVLATPNGFQMTASRTKRGTANDDGLGTSATVTFGENSRTEVLPELGTGETAVDEQIQPLSKVEVMGHKVHLKQGSEIIVPGGKVDIVATANPFNPLQNSVNRNESRILVDSGAKIDVSGVDTTVKAMESNIIEVELRLNQLKDSPLQRDGILFGKTILVDIRKGSPIADIQPDIDAIQRTLGERLAKGGEINLSSEGDTIIQKNATLDFSGGAVSYLDGFITTTKLTSNGRIFDISEAHPSLKYDGVYGEVVKVYEKWGVRKVWKVDGPFALARREAGYIEGHDAGRLSIISPNVLLDGDLNGGTVSGRLQRTLASKAKGGELLIDMRLASAAVQSVIFSSARNTASIGLELDDEFPVTDQNLTIALALQSGLIADSGIQDASILTHGTITVAANNTVRLDDGGSLSLQGGAIGIDGNIKGTGAHIALTTALNAETFGKLNGAIKIGKTSNIDLQGAWVNDRVTPFSLIDTTPVSIDGGSFSAKANGDVVLEAGSVIDVSGGAWINTSGTVASGDAGKVQLVAAAEQTGSNLVLEGTLKAFGLGNGGTLELEANGVAIRRRREDEIEGLRPLQIEDDFFGQGGFANYMITANLNGLTVDEGAQINLQQVNRILTGAAITQGNTDSIAEISRVAVLPAIQRSPSSLVLTSNHTISSNPDSNLAVGRNASISADPLSRVSLISDSSLIFDGSITARGGDVTLAVTPWQGLSALDPLYQPSQGIWLGDNASIDVSGIAVTQTDVLGRNSGEVYDGGSVTLDAARGFVATKANSLIDASGTTGVLNLPRISSRGFGLSYDPLTIGSHGGNVAISAAEGVIIEGRMSAAGGNAPGTSGGSLSVRLDSTRREEPTDEGIVLNFPVLPGILNLAQQKNTLFTPEFESGGDNLPVNLTRQGHLSANLITNGNFASLSLQADNEIRFQGDVNLTLQHALNLDTPKYGWESLATGDSGRVELTAAHAVIGSELNRTADGNPTGGEGKLTVNAGLIELFGGTYTSGFDEVNFNAGNDIRLRGIRLLFADRDFVGEFKTAADLNLAAGQIHTTTLSDFSLVVNGNPDGTITFKGNGQSRPVLSAYSKLTVKAPNIQQNGIVKAPFGEIFLDAAETIKFGANSITSVSAEGQVIPFGITEGGLEWLYPIGGQNLIVAAPDKNITIKADKIQREVGATIDLSGGGDLLAYEFIPGIGGSRDVLATSQSYAVIPGYSGYAPFDPLESPQSGLTVGDSLFLGAGSGLLSGFYTLLPAHYALLPGAYLITPQAGSRDMVPGTKTINLEGASVVAGFNALSGSSARDQRWSGFAVEPGSIALTRSQLNLTTANQFFAQQAINSETAMPRLPQDAGHLIFDAKTQLDLPRVLAGAANGGLAGLVDIVAENIAVVNTKNGLVNTVQLQVSDLDTFDVGSLLIGGVRSFDQTTGAVNLDVKSKTVTLTEDTVLKGQEMLLAATQKVELQKGASVVAVGKKPVSETSPVLEVSGDGALMRVSTGPQAIIRRTGSQGLDGDLMINEGTLVSSATGSVLFDSTRQLKMNGELEAGNSLNIGAEAINLGEVNDALTGLSFDDSQLSRLNSKELVLTSRSNINFYGSIYQTDADGIPLLDAEGRNLPVVLGNVVFDAAGFAGFDNAGKTARISAETLTLRNHANLTSVTGNGTGQLALSAEHLILDGGNFTVSGFESGTHFDLSGSVTGSGVTQLTSLGDITIKAGYITGLTGSETAIDAGDHALTLTKSTAAASQSALTGIAAELSLSAGSIAIDAPLLFRSGTVIAKAKSGDVTLGKDAMIDVSGIVVNAGLSDPVHLRAGRIDLTSQQQNIIAQAGSRMLLNAYTPKMAAGSLTLSAAEGQAILNGTINASGVNAALGGAVGIDVGSMDGAGFSGFNTIFTGSGFTGAVDLRVRNGDLIVAQNDAVNAHNIKLTADNGDLTLAGTLNARGADGGSINLNSNGKLTLASTATVNASAQGVAGNGGKVRLSSVEGGGIEIENGALIAVTDNGGSEGEVHLRADRLAGDVNIASISAGTITGDSTVTIEALKRFNYSIINATAIDAIKSDTASYMNAIAVGGIANAKFGPGYEIAPGVEVRSDGELSLSSKWDLVDWRYGANKTPGYLTLRASGDVLVQQDLTDAFANGIIQVTPTLFRNITDMLQTGRSWDYTVVAGSSDSADIQAVSDNAGDIRLANNIKVRTGTGDIGFYAGRDIVYGNDKSVVYTAGRPDEVDRFGLPITRVTSNFYVEYPLEGGDINFQAGRDIKGAVTNQIATDWLLRTGNWSRNETHTGERPTAWGIAVGTRVGSSITPDYRQNVGALGGGNITIRAEGDVSDLSVVIPTTGKQVGQRVAPQNPANQNYLTNVVEINGGGHLDLTSGGDLKGGMFYVDGGTATLNVAGSLTAGSFKTVSQPEMNPVLALGDSQFYITAGKDIAVQAIIDPMTLPQPQSKRPDLANLFFRYSADSAVSFISMAGKISLDNNASSLTDFLNHQRTGANTMNFSGSAREPIFVNPASLNAYALNGDIVLKESMILFPSPTGQFELFAANNIETGVSGSNINIAMSDTNPALLPSVLYPAASYNDANLRLVSSGQSNEPDKLFAPVPNHINDLKPALISTLNGNIRGINPLLFVMAKQTEVMTGKDIRNVSFQIQHNFEGAESIINAGRDFKYDIARNPSTGALFNVVQKLEVSGPGQLTVLAGRNVDLGSSEGITTVGNQINPALAADGANIDVISGLAKTNLDVAAFVSQIVTDRDAYIEANRQDIIEHMRQLTEDNALAESDAIEAFKNLSLTDQAEFAGHYLIEREVFNQAYQQGIIDYMRRFTGNDALAGSAAIDAFKKLSLTEQAHFNAHYLSAIRKPFNEMMKIQGARFSNAKNSFDNTADEADKFKFKQEMDLAQLEILAAIEVLFPGTTVLAGNDGFTIDPEKGLVFKNGNDADSILSGAFAAERDTSQTGDISMFFSRIHSTDGGDINLYAPNGGVNAGLAVNSSGAKDSSQLGIVALKKGAIHSMVRDDFQVNTTRVMTLGGGDIMIGSTDGNIDAGRGAKTALAAPVPIVRFDEKGNLIIELPPAVAGSGIRANVAPDGSQGDALLFALQGIIDASEAGVGGKDVTVGATAIVGSDNIDVGGVSVGVPVASTGSLAAGLGNVSNVAAAVADAVDSSGDAAKDAGDKMASAAALGIISVDILGFGDEEAN